MDARCSLNLTVAVGAIAASCASSPLCPPISDRRRAQEPPPEQTIDVQEGTPPLACEFVPDNQTCRDLAARPVPHPRCDVHDPKCGPESVTGAVGDKCYRPDAKRFPDGCRRWPVMRDRCTFDGECEAAGDLCLSYRRQKVLRVNRLMRGYPVEEGGCPRLPDPSPPMWCGCVQGRCTMFTQ